MGVYCRKSAIKKGFAGDSDFGSENWFAGDTEFNSENWFTGGTTKFSSETDSLQATQCDSEN